MLPLSLQPLTANDYWVAWRWATRPNGKLTKPPVCALRPDKPAETDDPATWASFSAAVAAVEAGRAAGVGYVVLYDRERVFLDLDKCRDPETGDIADWAVRLIEAAGSYTEVTPSGTGVRIVGLKGHLTSPIHKAVTLPGGGSVEIYFQATRYITVTGQRLPDSPDDLADIADLALDLLVAGGKAEAGTKEEFRPNAEAAAPLEDIVSALTEIPNPGTAVHYDDWVRVGLATFAASGGSPEGFAAWEEWSAKSEKFDAAECLRVWQSIRRSPPRKIGFGSLYHLAKTNSGDWIPPSWGLPPQFNGDPAPPVAEVAEVPWDEPPQGPPQPPQISAVDDFDPETGEIIPPLPKGIVLLNPQQWTEAAKPRAWLVPEWIPRCVVTALYGDGGMGKSLLAQQLMTSTAIGEAWCGLPVVEGRALGIMCEDDEDELHRRQEAINAAMGVTTAQLHRLRFMSRVGFDNILMAFDGKDVGVLTPWFDQLDAVCSHFRPDLLVMDTIADFFGGNENNRAQVRQFVQNSFGRLARKHQCGVLIAGHPSVSGISSGAGTGGSTAWNNTVRSRMYLTREEGEDVDPDSRVLSRKKANYAARDAEISLTWQRGVFVPTSAPKPPTTPDWNGVSELLDMIEEGWRKGEPWSVNPQAKGRYLPDVARHSDKLGRPSSRAIKALLQQWQANGVVANETVDKHAKKAGLRVLRRIDRGQ